MLEIKGQTHIIKEVKQRKPGYAMSSLLYRHYIDPAYRTTGVAQALRRAPSDDIGITIIRQSYLVGWGVDVSVIILQPLQPPHSIF